MKKSIYLITVLLCSVILYAQYPSIKFYLNDASIRSYNIEDIAKLDFIKSQGNYIMKIAYQKFFADSYYVLNLDSIKFDSINDTVKSLVIYLAENEPQRYSLAEIDSIIFWDGPRIISIEPESAKIGDELTIKGSGFGDEQGESTVSFKNIKAVNYTSWTDNEIKVKVPEDAETGKMYVTVNKFRSNEIIFFVIPYISDIFPTSGKVGDLISLFGSGFGRLPDSGFVSFNDVVAATYINWTSTLIQVEVPQGAESGKISVTVHSKKSNEVDFRLIIPPNITSINPVNFGVGEEITINGSNFGASQGSGIVLFNNVEATEITSWSNTQIKCKVPLDAASGVLTVVVDGVSSNEVGYKITSSVESVLIPKGSFQMGNTGSFGGNIYIPEDPVHKVTISRSFYMSKYEITQKLYISVMGTNPSNHRGPNYPVERISWYDAVAFCNALSERDGYNKCYTINGTKVTCDWYADGYRLPTEAEWEYACKAGTKTDYYSGNKESDLGRVAWYSGNSGDSTHIPGQKEPNKFGLYDMHGNVFEWVWDWSGTYDGDQVTDPVGPTSGTVKILRGGSWHNSYDTGMCRSSFRGWEDTPNSHSSTDGIRVVRVKFD